MWIDYLASFVGCWIKGVWWCYGLTPFRQGGWRTSQQLSQVAAASCTAVARRAWFSNFFWAASPRSGPIPGWPTTPAPFMDRRKRQNGNWSLLPLLQRVTAQFVWLRWAHFWGLLLQRSTRQSRSPSLRWTKLAPYQLQNWQFCFATLLRIWHPLVRASVRRDSFLTYSLSRTMGYNCS